jgi:MFS transporter, OFA family, oxalate/formate antiporter
LNWKPSRVFYGWWIVGAAFIITLFVSGSMFQSFTAFFEPVANEFGWSYAEVSLGFSLRSMAMGLLAPIVGILVDRLGPRKLIFFGATITAISVLLLSRINSLEMFYAAYLLMAVGLGFCTLTVLMTAIANWFQLKVGLASGIVTCGSGFGGLLIPVIVGLIDSYGWRSCLVFLAVAILVVLLPLSLFFRHKPEQYGYLPDGETRKSKNHYSALDTPYIDNTKPGMKRLLTSSPFWHLAVSFTVFHMAMISIVAHIMPYLSSIDMTRANASIIATIIPLLSIIGSFSFGRLGDKVDRKKVAAITYAMACTGLLCLASASLIGLWTLIPFLLFYGIGHGGSNAMRPSLTGDVFGRGNFGKVFGLMVGINSLISSAGPIIAGWAYDSWGSYQGIWFIFAGLIFISFISILTTPAYPRNQ